MLALISSVYALPSLIGSAIAGLIADYVGWRWVFLGLAPLLPLAAGMALPAMRRFGRTSNEPRDWGRLIAAARLAGGVALLTGGLGSGQSLFLTIVLIGVGAALSIPALLRLMPLRARPADSGLVVVLVIAILQNMAFLG
jgi:hypothetical protein